MKGFGACILCLIALLVAQCSSFSIPTKPRAVVTARPSTRAISSFSSLFSSQLQRRTLLRHAIEDSNAEKETLNVETDQLDDKDDVDKDGSLTRTLLLAVPLFCKFVIVLVIKFLTDVIVFPLLWMYRLARLTKKRIIKLFTPKDKLNDVNGSESSPSPPS